MVSAAACESSAVRPSRGGRQAAIRVARSSTVPRPATLQVCWSSSSFRTASNSAWVRSTEVPVAALTRRLRSSVRRSLLNQRWAAPASASAAQFTGTATAAGPSPAPSSHETTARGYLPRHARQEIGRMLPANKTAVHGVRKGIPNRTSGQSAARPQRPAKAPSHMTCPVNVSPSGGYPDGRTRRRGQEPAEPPQVRGISVRL